MHRFIDMCILLYTRIHFMYTSFLRQSRTEQSVRVGAGLYRDAGPGRALSRQTQDTAGFELLWQRFLLTDKHNPFLFCAKKNLSKLGILLM